MLDLFCGAGGAAVGYFRAGFDVVGVDISPQPRYPFPFIQGDALSPPVDLSRFDAIHASPPCQAYSAITPDKSRHPDLVVPTRDLLRSSGLPYVIENVVGAPLADPVQLCGSSFALPLRRHRLFETSFPTLVPPCTHGALPIDIKVYEHGRWYLSRFAKVYGKGGGKGGEHWERAMGIDWMSDEEIVLAIPPAYTEYLAQYLLAEINR